MKWIDIKSESDLPKKTGEYIYETASGFVGKTVFVVPRTPINEHWENKNIVRWLDESEPSPSMTAEVDTFVKKHLMQVMNLTADSFIHTEIESMWGGLEMASIQHFVETGKINGSFHQRLKKVMIDFAAKWHNTAASSHQPGGYSSAKKVCYCGSLRVALDAFKKAEYEAVLKGEIALLPCCMFVDIEREYGAESDYKQKADDLHKRKIDIADEVFVLNVGGYIGQSTRSEIDYAISIGKPVKYLEPLTQQSSGTEQ